MMYMFGLWSLHMLHEVVHHEFIYNFGEINTFLIHILIISLQGMR